MKKIRILSLILTVIMAVCALASCSPDDYVPAGMKKITTDAVDYKLYVPTNWNEDISTGVVSAWYSITDRSNINVMALALDNPGMTVREYFEYYAGQFVSTFPDIEFVDLNGTAAPADTTAAEETTAPTDETPAENTEAPAEDSADVKTPSITIPEGETMLIDGVPAERYVYTATVTGEKYKFMQVVAVRNGNAYIFTYTSTLDKYDLHVSEVNEILKYWSFGNTAFNENPAESQ